MLGGQLDWGGRLPKVTEALEGHLDWKPFTECKGKRWLDLVRATVRAGTEVGLSDPVVI